MEFVIIKKGVHFIVIGVFKSKFELDWQKAKVTNAKVLQYSKVDMSFTNF